MRNKSAKNNKSRDEVVGKTSMENLQGSGLRAVLFTAGAVLWALVLKDVSVAVCITFLFFIPLIDLYKTK